MGRFDRGKATGTGAEAQVMDEIGVVGLTMPF